jgi:hypothetical protein
VPEGVITGDEQRTAKALGEIKEGQVTRKDHNKGVYIETKGPTSNQLPDSDKKQPSFKLQPELPKPRVLH